MATVYNFWNEAVILKRNLFQFFEVYELCMGENTKAESTDFQKFSFQLLYGRSNSKIQFLRGYIAK